MHITAPACMPSHALERFITSSPSGREALRPSGLQLHAALNSLPRLPASQEVRKNTSASHVLSQLPGLTRSHNTPSTIANPIERRDRGSSDVRRNYPSMFLSQYGLSLRRPRWWLSGCTQASSRLLQSTIVGSDFAGLMHASPGRFGFLLLDNHHSSPPISPTSLNLWSVEFEGTSLEHLEIHHSLAWQ
ncbi:hypothetical protein C8R44DRAFT_732082 [Mycena epipterygia]|nr:hypothetical protein C8R44DRAFT_732082 [Mycena epipterygia]